MINLYFGFEGHLTRLKFFLASLGQTIALLFLLIVLAHLLELDLAALFTKKYNTGGAVAILLIGVLATYTSAALFAKRLGFEGPDGNITKGIIILSIISVLLNTFGAYAGVDFTIGKYVSYATAGGWFLALFKRGLTGDLVGKTEADVFGEAKARNDAIGKQADIDSRISLDDMDLVARAAELRAAEEQNIQTRASSPSRNTAAPSPAGFGRRQNSFGKR